MPIIKSAKKRVRVAEKATIRNAKTKRTLRESVKEFQAVLKAGETSEINMAKQKAEKAIDTAAKKNVIHKNKAARKKSQLASAAKSTTVQPKAKKVVKKTAVAKKPTPKSKKQTKA